MDSILGSVKKVLGIHEDYDAFDTDVIMHINTAFFLLNQLGVGPEKGYRIEDGTSKWSDYLDSSLDLDAVKSYIFVRVRLLFDRPETSYGIQALERQASEFEWRLSVQVDRRRDESERLS